MLNPSKGKLFKDESHAGPSHHHFHHLCHKYMGQNVTIELDDGNEYHGRLHSYDKDNMYLILPGEQRDSRIIFVAPFFPGFGIFGFPFFRIRRFRPFFW
ncbi:LSM domain-containing protein [Fictibacillus phosphorivorans]|uniref:LSM domain-containing protein n=1 Tax=Fictibacillus phosphorivorans TaxID=1221500 RepID=UPI00203C1315|nr:LSM domain-containing protein [Fictibacillus phosphorivorans]MCM3718771.1 LSM domain-containing protein [Fictibacillus phosphorivorans]MCM3776394.1 LSM domain-containing protein [Fictibacillus phosphorivorans]